MQPPELADQRPGFEPKVILKVPLLDLWVFAFRFWYVTKDGPKRFVSLEWVCPVHGPGENGRGEYRALVLQLDRRPPRVRVCVAPGCYWERVVVPVKETVALLPPDENNR